MSNEARELAQRITDYLSGGGLFNPEMAKHQRVRDLLIDCRTELERTALEARNEALELLQEYARQHVEEYGCDADPCDKCKRVRSLAGRASKGAAK